MKFVVTISVLAALATGGWIGYQKFVQVEQDAPFVTKPLDRGDIVRTVAATGTIEPLVKVIVGSQVSGNIEKWYTDFNDRVTAGEKLAIIDPARFQTVFDQTQADLELAKASEEEASVRHKDSLRELNRLKGLLEANTASSNEFMIQQATSDAALAALHGAQANVKAAQARLNAAKVDLDRTVIRSPIEGIVIARNIEDGQTVAASLQAPELFIIANDLKRMQVNANVSESDIGLIEEGRPARFTVDAFPGRTFEGTISQIRFNATALDGVVTYITLIDVPNEDLALRPGMTANVTFVVAKAEDVLRVPTAALRFDPNPPDPGAEPVKRKLPGSPTIYLYERGQPIKREVQIGLTDGAFTEIKSGDLHVGDMIVVERNWRSGMAARRPDPTRSLQRG